MKGAKSIWNDEDGYLLMQVHWDIFWDLIEMKGYDKKVLCGGCNSYTKYNSKDHHMSLRCAKCGKTYSPTADTIFANSKIWLPVWLKAIYLLKEINPSMTLKVFAEQLDCTNVTACNMKRKIKSISEDSIEYKLFQKHKDTIKREF